MTDSHSNPSSIEFSAPGKTFLLGEYVALDGGPSIVLATAPSFVLSASMRASAGPKTSAYSVFHPQSPAGRLMARNPELYESWDLRFKDPHRGRGGLGASSAQFALCWVLEKALLGKRQAAGPVAEPVADPVAELAPASTSGNLQKPSQREVFAFERDWRELLNDYRVCSELGEGRPPSGADVVAQVQGGVSYFDGIHLRARDLGWVFDALDFVLIRTGKKLATHVHLRDLGSLPFEALRETVAQGARALEIKDENAMIDSVIRASRVLSEANLVADHTKEILSALSRLEGVLAVKGCGALGADVVLALCKGHESRLAIEKWAKARGLETCGSSRDLAWPELSLSEQQEQTIASSSVYGRGVRS